LPTAKDDDLSTRSLDSGSSLEEVEARVLDHAMTRAKGNVSEAARLLGLTRPQMAYRQKHRQSQATPAPSFEVNREAGAI
jgi:transcriptional regulator with GAF, ATPase, and Fis domain